MFWRARATAAPPTTMRAIGILALASLAACAARPPGPPAIEIDRTACSHCRMLVSEVRYAAAYAVPGREPRVFDDIGCLLDAAAAELEQPARYWFKDATTGGWIDGASAVFVKSASLRTPMAGGIAAYSTRAAADDAAARLAGRVLSPIDALFVERGVRK